MSLMSREDMLRELELLPVWQLKQPLPARQKTPEPTAAEELPVPVKQTVMIEQPVVATDAAASLPLVPPEPLPTGVLEMRVQEAVVLEGMPPAEMPQPELAQREISQPAPLRLLLSEDGRFAFLIEPHPAEGDTQAIETLFMNMIRAMQLSCRVDVTDTADKLFAGHTPRFIISMGEAPANLLSGRSHALDEWRTMQQQNQPLYENIPLMVTYHPAHLLENASDKAHAWRDLCLAIKLVQNL